MAFLIKRQFSKCEDFLSMQVDYEQQYIRARFFFLNMKIFDSWFHHLEHLFIQLSEIFLYRFQLYRNRTAQQLTKIKTNNKKTVTLIFLVLLPVHQRLISLYIYLPEAQQRYTCGMPVVMPLSPKAVELLSLLKISQSNKKT